MSASAKRPLYELPVASTSFDTEAVFSQPPDELSFSYRRGDKNYRGAIRFLRVAATRTLAERACTAWHIDGAYDTLAEVTDSEWRDEVWSSIASHNRKFQGELRHFIIYLDSSGCFEALAAGWRYFEEEIHR